MDTIINTFFVLVAIKSIQKQSPKGDTVLLHPNGDWTKKLSIIDLDNLLHKFEKDDKIIKIQSLSCKSPRKLFRDENFGIEINPIVEESYKLKLLRKFDGFYKEYILANAKHIERKVKSKSSKPTEEKSLNIKYTDNREIILNDIFLLARPNFNSVNDLVFSYLYTNPNNLVTRDQLINEARVKLGAKRLHDIVKELGFKKELGRAFFSINKTNIMFRNPVDKQTLDDLGINHIKIT